MVKIMSPTASMRDDHELEVESTESLIRRFPSESENDFPTSKFPRISHLLPNKRDQDGLSFNREEFISAEDLRNLAQNPNVRHFGGVLAVIAGWLRDLGLTIRLDPSDSLGHVIVPEMNRKLYSSSRAEEERIKELADKLVRLIAESNSIRIHPIPIPRKTKS